MAFLDGTGLGTVWGRIKAWVAQYANITSSTSNGSTTNTLNIGTNSVVIPNRTSELNNDAGFITDSDIPEGAAASSATPLMDGTASAGESNAFARGDHVHPSDTTKADKVTGGTAGNLVSLDSNGNIVDSGVNASNAGTDTKNTAGSTQVSFGSSETRMYLIGAKTMGNNPQTYADNGVYVTPEGDIVANGTNLNTGKTETVDGVSGDIITRYGACSTSASTPTKTVTLEEGTISSLSDGTRVTVNFINRNTDDNPKLNVNNTGAYNIACFNGAFSPNDLYGIIDFIYVNEFWYIVQDVTAYSGIDNILDKIGQANGIASLDSSGKVPSSQLPSYVDDVVEIIDMASSDPSTCAAGDIYYNTSSKKLFTATAADTWGSTGVDPQAGVIYILTKSNHATYSQNSEFRWGGSSMVQLYDGGASALSSAEIEAACPYNS